MPKTTDIFNKLFFLIFLSQWGIRDGASSNLLSVFSFLFEFSNILAEYLY